jgi:hypothetical protein
VETCYNTLRGLAFRKGDRDTEWQYWREDFGIGYLRISPLDERHWTAFRLKDSCSKILNLGGYGFGVVDLLETFTVTLVALSLEEDKLVLPMENIKEVAELATNLQSYLDETLETLRAEHQELLTQEAAQNREALDRINAIVTGIRKEKADARESC